MKRIDTLIEAEEFWNKIPKDAQQILITIDEILYGPNGLGDGNKWFAVLEDQKLANAVNDIMLNAEELCKHWEYIENIAGILSWSLDRMHILKNVLEIYKLSRKESD